MEKKKMSNYVKQLKEFQSYMNACFEVLVTYGDDKTIDSFNDSEFEITFREKTVKLANMATVYQGIEEIIQAEIDDMESV